MNTQIIAKDSSGVQRCYGIGRTREEALQQCKMASSDYLRSRRDIKRLYLHDGHTDEPIIDAGRCRIMTVSAGNY